MPFHRIENIMNYIGPKIGLTTFNLSSICGRIPSFTIYHAYIPERC